MDFDALPIEANTTSILLQERPYQYPTLRSILTHKISPGLEPQVSFWSSIRSYFAYTPKLMCTFPLVPRGINYFLICRYVNRISWEASESTNLPPSASEASEASMLRLQPISSKTDICPNHENAHD
jgi:hypothetical protein